MKTVSAKNWPFPTSKTKANRAVAKIDKELKQLELFDNVTIETTANDAKSATIPAQGVMPGPDQFELFALKSEVL